MQEDGVHILRSLSDDTAQIAFSENLLQLKTAFTEAVNKLGFVSYNISVNRNSSSEFMEKPTLTTWTTKDLDNYIDDKWVSRDPLMRHLNVSNIPLLWHQSNFDTADGQEYYDYVRFHGITGELTLPLPAIRGRTSAITLLTLDDKPLPPQVIPAVLILSNVAVARMVAFKEGDFCEYDIRRFELLSGLQVEILRWMAKGKTNSEIAKIVDRSERAIAYHVSEILGKIDVTSRAQAAAFYAAMGLD